MKLLAVTRSTNHIAASLLTVNIIFFSVITAFSQEPSCRFATPRNNVNFKSQISNLKSQILFPEEKPAPQELSLRPIFVTARVFQLAAKRGGSQELNDQIFKMRTASLSDHEKWITVLKKTYPGFEIALIRTELRKVFRTSRPSIVTIAKHADGRTIEMSMTGAQSVGDGEKPGTSLIPEIGFQFGVNAVGKPVTYLVQPLEVESGMTYFYAVTGLKFNPTDYVKFFRPNSPVKPFDDYDIYLIVAYSVDLDKTAEPARNMDERQSVQLQAKATKKVEPEVSANLREAGLGGFIRVRIEISADGKVSGANIHFSSFPEINNNALAAARQWEFPATLFADDKNPITGFITFSIAAKSEEKTRN